MAEQYKADLRGIFTPETIWKTEIEMNRLEDGDRLLILLDDPNSEDWIIRWAHKNGHDVVNSEKVATGFHMTLVKGGWK